jgi:two-component system CheB/CheR fusion protein
VQAALLLTKTLEAEAPRVEQKLAAGYLAATLSSLSQMIEILALLSRIEAGLQVVPLRSCKIAAVLEATIQRMAKVASERRLQLRVRNMQGVVRSNPKLLIVATKSLLLNAMKLSCGDGISVCCRRRGNQLRLEVQFSGASIAGSSEKGSFVQLPLLASRPIASELGLGLLLLESLCHRLGHSLHHRHLARDNQLLVIELPLASTSL